MAGRRNRNDAIRIYLQMSEEEKALIAAEVEASKQFGATIVTRDTHAVRLSEPPVLLDVAIQHVPLSKMAQSNAGHASSSSTIAASQGPAAPEDLTDLIDRSTCPKCAIDQTVSEEDVAREWTPVELEQHMAQFHTAALQCTRWYHRHKACFLCAVDGEVIKFGSRATYDRHMDPQTGEHSDDPRLYRQPPLVEIPVSLPANFRSLEEMAHAVSYEDFELPANFVTDEAEMRELLKGVSVLALDLDTLPSELGIDVRAVELAFKRLKLSKCGFVYVYHS